MVDKVDNVEEEPFQGVPEIRAVHINLNVHIGSLLNDKNKVVLNAKWGHRALVWYHGSIFYIGNDKHIMK